MFDNLSEFLIRCPCHNSAYGIDGSLYEGPAELPLVAYDFEFDGQDLLTIRIPCWGFTTSVSPVVGAGNPSVRIDFYANDNVIYDLSYRRNLTDGWQLVPFATTPQGPRDQTTLTRFAGDASIYADAPATSGYFAVGMQIQEV